MSTSSLVSTPLFTVHSRQWRANRYVYPVISRRSRGLSIGVNLNPDGVCNFDCVYCCVDRSAPPAVTTVDEDLLRAELDHMLGLAANGEIWNDPVFAATPSALRRLNDVAFSGDGEPTSYPRFAQVARLAGELISWRGLDAQGVKIVVITNATLLDRPAVSQALVELVARPSEVWAKLDAGTEAHYQRVERAKTPLKKILANLLALGRLRPITIQSLFMRLHGDGPDAAEITAYIGRLRDLRDSGARIERVQVYTTARATTEAWVTPLEVPLLDAIAARVRELGLLADVYPGPG